MVNDTHEELLILHRDVDEAVAALERRHRERLACRRGCAGCCVDDLRVFEVEAERIVRHHRELVSEGEPHPEGACAFLDDEGGCRIYADRPYVCRTQGLPLRWLDEDVHGSPVEYRDICELNEDGEPITDLDPRHCWTLGPVEASLRELQQRGYRPESRVRLRDLFARAEPPVGAPR